MRPRLLSSVGPPVPLPRNFDSYHHSLVQVVSHAMKRTKRSMQSPPILRTRNKRCFVRLRCGMSGWSSAMAT
jgi:hypothetical protein